MIYRCELRNGFYTLDRCEKTDPKFLSGMWRAVPYKQENG